MNFRAAFIAQPKALVMVEALVALVVIWLIDYHADAQWSLFIFYAFPIALLVWRGDSRAAIGLAVLCAFAWWLANLESHRSILSEHAYLWAAFTRLLFYLFVAIGGMAMRNQRDEARARMEAMMRARELEQEIVRVSEREQMRIGQDLHDGLCQNLAAIDCAAACLKSDLEGRALPEAVAAGDIQKMLQDALLEARNLARGIFPVQMDAEGLPTALEELVATTNRLRQTPASIDVQGEVKIADPQVAMHLYRIAQQALNNAVQHAQAGRVAIRLRQDGGRGTMSIADDGCGFSHAEVPSRGMGLRTMHYRARLIGADLTVTTPPGGGTEVRCHFNMNHASNS
jgi:signal transduction histidine kinase